jgi:hypothetical protein
MNSSVTCIKIQSIDIKNVYFGKDFFVILWKVNTNDPAFFLELILCLLLNG